MKRLCLIILLGCIMAFIGCSNINNFNKDMQKAQAITMQAEQGMAEIDSEFSAKYNTKAANTFSPMFATLISNNQYSNWLEGFVSEKDRRPLCDYNIVNFIREFSIKKSDFISKNNQYIKLCKENDWDISKAFTPTEIEVLYSGDSSLINKTFVSENALFYNGEIYTMEWFYNNSIDVYKTVSIPLELLQEKCNMWVAKSAMLKDNQALSVVLDKVNGYSSMITDKREAEDYLYDSNYCWEYYNVPSDFANLVGEDKFDNWADDYKAVNFNGVFPAEDFNILSFVRYFNVPREQFETVNLNYAMKNGNPPFAVSQVEALYSNDWYLIDIAFINPQAVYYNGMIYPPKWFVESDATAYVESNIPIEIIKAYLVKWEKDNILSFDKIEKINQKIAIKEITRAKSGIK